MHADCNPLPTGSLTRAFTSPPMRSVVVRVRLLARRLFAHHIEAALRLRAHAEQHRRAHVHAELVCARKFRRDYLEDAFRFFLFHVVDVHVDTPDDGAFAAAVGVRLARDDARVRLHHGDQLAVARHFLLVLGVALPRVRALDHHLQLDHLPRVDLGLPHPRASGGAHANVGIRHARRRQLLALDRDALRVSV
eukprot:CAMPEP_0113262716 /NCGR_PEP_ID=MMETSP0008_2-20120614/18071_1 /TAXON_ID=97485 /ORGANISM="Prymnesium parvum" /LENGTH=192 /DNA_ID=CAMNT_0000111395 /DNA_START=170 /DNA_END=748 /DNA_ORIENTATION=- /assembly_acc=CAM_ASM_000153